jgi:hypothetical protein
MEEVVEPEQIILQITEDLEEVVHVQILLVEVEVEVTLAEVEVQRRVPGMVEVEAALIHQHPGLL